MKSNEKNNSSAYSGALATPVLYGAPPLAAQVLGVEHPDVEPLILEETVRVTNELLGKAGRGFEIGHSYLLDVPDGRALREVWEREVLPAIEDWLDFDPTALRPFSWESTIRRIRKLEATLSGDSDTDGEPLT